MHNILIIGVGALGKRHLSSILNSELELNVYCYDINPNALDNFEWEDKYNNKILKMIVSFEELPNSIDFALFAMTSNGRSEMFDRLVAYATVKNILFEKVLFQKIEDYKYVGEKLEELGIKAWVNCARRQMDSYQDLKEELTNAKEMTITITGGEWGLACNAIHEIDLVAFLAGSDNLRLNDFNDLVPGIYNSKRKGYKEIYGTISGTCGRCKGFSINCMKDTNVPDVISVSTDIGQYYIIESKRKIFTMTLENNYELQELDFKIPYQSQMTQFVMEDILNTGNSHLASYKESAKLHIEFIKPLIEHFKKNGMEEDICPIT